MKTRLITSKGRKKFFPLLKKLKNQSNDIFDHSKSYIEENSQQIQNSQMLLSHQNNFDKSLTMTPNQPEFGLYQNGTENSVMDDTMVKAQDDDDIDMGDYQDSEAKSNNMYQLDSNFNTGSANIKDLTMMNFHEKYSQIGSGLSNFEE